MEHYSEFEELLNQLKVKTTLEIKTTLDKTFDNYQTNKKEVFLDWLEYEALISLKLKLKNTTNQSKALSDLTTLSNNYKQSKIDFLSNWIKSKRFELQTNQRKVENDLENPYPNIFKSSLVYKRFIEYTSKYIIDFYLDYSFLKKKLEAVKLIHYTKDNDFVNFLLNDLKIITSKDFQTYLSKESKFYSLSKSNSDSRLNNFNHTFKGLI